MRGYSSLLSIMESTALALSQKRIDKIILTILLIYPLVGTIIDLVAPSLPAISRAMGGSTELAKNLISIYLLGYGLGNFLFGFLSDAWGRRKFLVGGMLGFTVISILPVLFPCAEVLLLSLFLQGLSVGAFAVCGRAVFSDVLNHEKLMRMMPALATMWGIGPVVGPVIGGYLQFYFNWQAGFVFFASFGFLATLALFLIVPETHFKRQPLNFERLKGNLKELISHRVFMGSIVIMGFTYSILIVFNTLAPFLIQVTLGYSPVYFGHWALGMGLCFLLGSLSCRKLMQKNIRPERIFAVMLPFVLILVLVSIGLAWLEGHNIWILLIPSLLMFYSVGILYPTGMAKGMSLFRHIAGSAAALMNLVGFGITGLSAGLMGFVLAGSALPIMLVYLILILCAGSCYWFLIRAK